jgi:type IV secretory pathway component VirB8
MWALATLAKLQNARARTAQKKLESMIARVFVVFVVGAVIVVLA